MSGMDYDADDDLGLTDASPADALYRRGASSTRASAQNREMRHSDVPLRLRLYTIGLTLATLLGVASAIIGWKLSTWVTCSTEVSEQSFMFGNACQDRLLGAQVIILVCGVFVSAVSCKALLRRRK